ncbi:hypothetical protein [Pontibacter sp. G13]|uniref:hypothetical protein n=1 Tax=Pontibacter sp. G13 TaxID=3074898 RepID=UPI00288C3F9B|nr:hypothetical protein [Pontibacter sp. G13]WNJ18387.1 hypothetical protein RJD25_26330 [Pontibacter sp. G13]
MMSEESFEAILEDFVEAFNVMCKTQRRDFLVREKVVDTETGPEVIRRKVTYRVRKSFGKWQVEAVTKGFWIFRRKYPLLKFAREEDVTEIWGLYAKELGKVHDDDLAEALRGYQEKCRKLPHNAFVRS